MGFVESNGTATQDTGPYKFSKWRKYAVVFTMWFVCHAASIATSIRYGFLADSFSKRGLSGKIYGFTEGSMFIGFSGLFLFTITEWFMRRFNAKYIFCGCVLSLTCISASNGVIYYLIASNEIFVALSILLRILQGAFVYAIGFVITDFLRSNFPDEFDGINGIIYMGYYSGHGVAETFGCFLYDLHGYYAAYILPTTAGVMSLTFCALFIPRTKCYLASSEEDKEDADKVEKNDYKRVSWSVVFPLIACLLINANYGYIQVTLTPYLNMEFGKSISFSGFVLTFVSIGMAVGSLASGITLQKRVFKTYIQMAIGAFLVSLGLFIVFPPPSFTFLYNNVPYFAFIGIFLAGFGDPFISIAALRAMFETQEAQNSVVTPKQFGFLSGLWLTSSGFYYLGSVLAGILIDCMSFSNAALLLIALGVISIVTCVITKYTTTPAAVPATDETTPLIVT